jgi:hypothetical protein
MGGVGMPLWFVLGLAALGVGSWFSKSGLVNIMLMVMCGAGLELADTIFPVADQAELHYAMYGILIFGIIFALVQIITRVKHI